MPAKQYGVKRGKVTLNLSPDEKAQLLTIGERLQSQGVDVSDKFHGGISVRKVVVWLAANYERNTNSHEDT